MQLVGIENYDTRNACFEKKEESKRTRDRRSAVSNTDPTSHYDSRDERLNAWVVHAVLVRQRAVRGKMRGHHDRIASD